MGEPYKVSMEGVHWFVRGRGMFTQCHDREQGHWPLHIVELMRGRNVLTVALDLVGGLRGANDLCLSECANAMTVLEWYMEKWEPSDCPFDGHALALIKTAHKLADEWFQRESLEAGLRKE